MNQPGTPRNLFSSLEYYSSREKGSIRFRTVRSSPSHMRLMSHCQSHNMD